MGNIIWHANRNCLNVPNCIKYLYKISRIYLTYLFIQNKQNKLIASVSEGQIDL